MSTSDISDRYEKARARLDNDTRAKGTEGPFDYWEHDHTGLVHVLWNVRRLGLTVEDNADEIATLILHSRWAAAYRANSASEETP